MSKGLYRRLTNIGPGGFKCKCCAGPSGSIKRRNNVKQERKQLRNKLKCLLVKDYPPDTER